MRPKTRPLVSQMPTMSSDEPLGLAGWAVAAAGRPRLPNYLRG